jgi:hypothetical protein
MPLNVLIAVFFFTPKHRCMFVAYNFMYVIMKKILLLLTVVMGLWSCSTDNEEDFVQYGYNVSQKANENEAAALSTTSCFTSVTGQVHVDVSNGIGNPVVVFTSVVTGNVNVRSKYRVRLEVQPLTDCDDMNSDVGTLLIFSLGTIQNVVVLHPSISVLPANMPLCYKWRFVFESIAGTPINSYCYSSSEWYESPLF